MQSNKICFEIKKDDRSYQLYCSPEAPLGELYDVLGMMTNHVLEIMKRTQETEKTKI